MKRHILGITLFFSLSVLTAQAEGAFFCPPCGMECDLVAHLDPGRCAHCGMTFKYETFKERKSYIERLKKRPKVAVYIHNGMEILDFAGPVEVLTYAGFEVFTVGVDASPIISQGMVTITPTYTIDNCPKADILSFFGGNGSKASDNAKTLAWLQEKAPEAGLIFSVCTGAFFLAKAGLLEGKQATTFHTALEALQEEAPTAQVLNGVRFVEDGKILTTAGVAAGIDGALHLVAKYMGIEKAKDTAAYMEYDCWNPNVGKVVSK